MINNEKAKMLNQRATLAKLKNKIQEVAGSAVVIGAASGDAGSDDAAGAASGDAGSAVVIGAAS
eukprot:1184283-Prorocentrum_minimum.AAC.3